MSTISPILYEIIRSRLLATTEEMRIALQAVSGSPTVTDASDFFTGLFLPNGDFASMGFQVTFQAPVIGRLIRHINAHPGKYPVNPGDMFLANDPYIGALHQNDVQLCGPIFVGDEIIGWAGVEAHETDVGGMDFASWSPKARDVRQEGIRFPCAKLVDGGKMREDVLEILIGASRLPDQLGLDIRAFIATLNVAQDRINTLVARYGAAAIREVMGRMIEGSEARLRARLAEMPDGIYRSVDYLEHDGHANILHRVALTMTKAGDSLTLDFSDSSPQAKGFINATRAGLEGGVAGSLLPLLCYDIPWNEGALRCAKVIAEDGLIVTAQFPAPVGAATVETIWVVSNVVTMAISKMLAASPTYAYRAMAVSAGAMATFNLGGVNQYGEPFGLHLMDPLAAGSGAFQSKDGVDSGGPITAPMPSIADVERNELVAPLFYTHRRLAPDTGGAGQYRGGVGVEIGLTLGGIKQAEALIMTHGAEVPNGIGGFGAWPGGTVKQSMAWGGVANGVAVGGRREEFGPKPGMMTMTDRDLFLVTWQGGGGWGDALDRDPAMVWRDVAAGTVTAKAAKDVYGVICGVDGVDANATDTQRNQMRKARIGDGMSYETVIGETIGKIGPNLCLIRDGQGVHVATAEGVRLATGSTRWRDGAIRREVRSEADQHRIALHEDLTAWAYYCPKTGRLLALDVQEKSRIKTVHDIELKLSA